MTYSVEEVRKLSSDCWYKRGSCIEQSNALTAYADLLEQIERAKAGIPKWEDERERIDPTHMFAQYKFVEDELNAYRAVAHLLPRGEVFTQADQLVTRHPSPNAAAPSVPSTPTVTLHVGAHAADPAAQIDTCTELNCPRCRTQPEHRGDMEHAGIGSRFTANAVALGEAHKLAKIVWEAMDRKACPAHWMQVAYEAVLAASHRVPDVTDDLAHWIIAAIGDIPYSTLTVESVKAALITAAPQPKEAKS